MEAIPEVAKLRTLQSRVLARDLRKVKVAPKRADPELQTPEHRAWSLAVRNRAGWRCEWVEDGKRCTRSKANGDQMLADHIVERKDGGDPLDPKNGQCLCNPHNTSKGIRARAARMGVGGPNL